MTLEKCVITFLRAFPLSPHSPSAQHPLSHPQRCALCCKVYPVGFAHGQVRGRKNHRSVAAHLLPGMPQQPSTSAGKAFERSDVCCRIPCRPS